MKWNLKHISTNNDGTINTNVSLLGWNKLSVNETAGNELYLKSGDLLIKIDSEISLVSDKENWIAVYIDNILFNFYYLASGSYKYDTKRGLYEYRLQSIQKTFFKNIEEHKMHYDFITMHYNTGLSGIAKKLYFLSLMKGDGTYSTFLYRWAFPIGSVLDGLEGKHNQYGYLIDTVTHPIKLPNGTYDLPFIWRGMSVPDNMSDQIVIDQTFESQKYCDLVVTGITTEPVAYSSIYSHNSDNYMICDVSLSGGDGTIKVRNITDDSTPLTSGTFYRVSGAGDSEFDFSSRTTITEYYYTTWKEIFEIVSIGWNAFIRILPKIESNTLKVDIDIKPKIEEPAAGQITDVLWSERKLIMRKFEIDGVLISTLNWDYELEDIEHGQVFSASVPVATREKSNSNWENDLYIGISEQDTEHGGYDFRYPKNFFSHVTTPGLEFVKQWYENQIGAGDGYEGKILILYNDGSEKLVRVLDQLQFNSTTIQLNSIKINKDFLANIEGIVL